MDVRNTASGDWTNVRWISTLSTTSCPLVILSYCTLWNCLQASWMFFFWNIAACYNGCQWCKLSKMYALSCGVRLQKEGDHQGEFIISTIQRSSPKTRIWSKTHCACMRYIDHLILSKLKMWMKFVTTTLWIPFCPILALSPLQAAWRCYDQWEVQNSWQ